MSISAYFRGKFLFKNVIFRNEAKFSYVKSIKQRRWIFNPVILSIPIYFALIGIELLIQAVKKI